MPVVFEESNVAVFGESHTALDIATEWRQSVRSLARSVYDETSEVAP